MWVTHRVAWLVDYLLVVGLWVSECVGWHGVCVCCLALGSLPLLYMGAPVVDCLVV